MNKQINNNTKQPKSKIKKKKSIFTIMFMVIVFLVIFMIYTITNWLIQSISYSSYTKQIKYYKYNELYTNKKATAFQKVTNIDMLKMIIGSINNTTDISEVSLVPELDKLTEDEAWYETAKVLGLTNNIEEKHLNKKSKEIDAIINIVKVLEQTRDIEIEQAKLDISAKKLKDYSKEDIINISKAITLGLLENKDGAISNRKLTKGELNKMIIQVISKYATVYYKTIDIDENGNIIKNDVYLVTDKDKLPKNEDKYPYIVSNIDKTIYEYDFNILNEDNFKEPKEVYSEYGKLYAQIDEVITNYFDAILNVNYQTINERDYASLLNMSTLYSAHETDVAAYVSYVKNNKIELKGHAEPLLPIMYNNGDGYVVRTKIEFEVINSNTQYNLLYGDETSKIKYNGKQIIMYVDVPMGLTFNSKSLLVDSKCNAKNMVSTNENVVVEK